MKVNGKKITVKHYLNKRVKPRVSALHGILYPVYTQVTYNRQNTHFHYFKKHGFGFDEAEFERKFSGEDSAFQREISDLNELIEKVVKDGVEKLGDKFSLKGFSNLLEIYTSPIFWNFDTILAKEVYFEFQDILTVSEFRDAFGVRRIVSDEEFKDNHTLDYFIFFVPSYSVKTSTLEAINLIKRLSENLFKKIACYFHLHHFENYYGNESSPFHFKFVAWKNMGLRDEFKSFLLKKINGESFPYYHYEKVMNPDPVQDFYQTHRMELIIQHFPLTVNDVDTYLMFIDDLVEK